MIYESHVDGHGSNIGYSTGAALEIRPLSWAVTEVPQKVIAKQLGQLMSTCGIVAFGHDWICCCSGWLIRTAHPMLGSSYVHNRTGWWFATFLFFHMLGIIISTD